MVRYFTLNSVLNVLFEVTMVLMFVHPVVTRETVEVVVVHVLVAIVVTLLAPWVPSQEYEPPLVLGEHKLGVDLLLQTGNNQLRVI